jgi:hypothetical protein
MDLRAQIAPARRGAVLTLWAAREVGGEIALVRWPVATRGWRRPALPWRGCGPMARTWTEVAPGEVALRAGCRDLAAPQAARLAAFLVEHRLYLPHIALASSDAPVRYELVPPVPVGARAPGGPSVVEEAHATARALPGGHLAGRARVDPSRKGRGQHVGLPAAHPSSL